MRWVDPNLSVGHGVSEPDPMDLWACVSRRTRATAIPRGGVNASHAHVTRHHCTLHTWKQHRETPVIQPQNTTNRHNDSHTIEYNHAVCSLLNHNEWILDYLMCAVIVWHGFTFSSYCWQTWTQRRSSPRPHPCSGSHCPPSHLDRVHIGCHLASQCTWPRGGTG